MNTINVVCAVFVNSDFEVLAFKRNASKQLPLFWEFPGGKVENNESNEEALFREIIEELNIEITVGRYITTSKFEYEFGIVELTAYIAYCDISKIKLKEHLDMKWINLNNYNTVKWAPADLPILEALKTLNLKGVL
ncbi:(deoxy)nucleoside triphosphate pyrophosphohydrolase [Mycoplasma sp. P36-A1]|uniref:(deoxy)nucleoside triphosphate pyrophosphohydrolase n=1 Tax=Mycoplasma sp. P36-A1 TaxID=3252900 RepID=UPI003C2EF1DF